MVAASIAAAVAAVICYGHLTAAAAASSASPSALRGRGRRGRRTPTAAPTAAPSSTAEAELQASGAAPSQRPAMATAEEVTEAEANSARLTAAEMEPFPFLRPSPSPPSQSSPSTSPSALPSSHPLWSSLTGMPSCLGHAPGKVLLTGGYLVLERSHSGVVLSLNANFHSALTPLDHPAVLPLLATPSPASALAEARMALQADKGSADDLLALFLLHSPQRFAGLVEYWVRIRAGRGSGGGAQLLGSTQVQRHPPTSEDNPFVSTSLYYALHLLSSLLPSSVLRAKLSAPLLLSLSGDFAFYSALPPSSSSSASSPTPDGKTGLGSSATLTASLIAALLQLCGLLDDLSPSFALPPLWLQTSAAAAEAGPSSAPSLDSSFLIVSADLSTRSSHSLPRHRSEQKAAVESDGAQLLKAAPFVAPSSASPSHFFPSFSLPLSSRVSMAHHLTQLVHCLAQGKVGSGFDVAAAFYGSHVYTRFSPSCIQPLLDAAEAAQERAGSLLFDHRIDRRLLTRTLRPLVPHSQHSDVDAEPLRASPHSASSSHSASSPSTPLSRTPSPLTPAHCPTCAALNDGHVEWDEVIAPIALPTFIHLLLVDVQGGAKTPSMVQRVLRWRQQDTAGQPRRTQSSDCGGSSLDLTSALSHDHGRACTVAMSYCAVLCCAVLCCAVSDGVRVERVVASVVCGCAGGGVSAAAAASL